MGDKASSVSDWLKFFNDAGIPTGLGANYAVIFCDHRIQKDLLGELSRDILVEMGIKAMGDIIAILKHAQVVAKQMSREKNSKLFETKMEIEAEEPPRSPKKVKLQSTDGKVDKSVFSRLGQDQEDPKSARVFKRLGEPVVTTTTGEPPKKTERKLKRKPAPSKQQSSSDDEDSPPRKPSKKVALKRKHVLDRLGPEADLDENQNMKSSVAIVSSRKSVMQRLGRTPDPEESSSGEEADNSSSSSEEVRQKVVFNPAPKSKRVRLNPRENFVVTKILKPTNERQTTANVMSRLGSKVTSSTKGSPIIKRVISSPSTRLISKKLGTKPLAMDTETARTSRPRIQRPMISTRPKLSLKKGPRAQKELAMDQEQSKAVGVRRKLQRPKASGTVATGKRTLAMDSVKSSSMSRRLQLQKNVIKLKPSSLARKSLLNLQAKPISHNLRQRLKTPQAKPISSNRVSSTTSAGIFKRERKANVFDRLGAN